MATTKKKITKAKPATRKRTAKKKTFLKAAYDAMQYGGRMTQELMDDAVLPPNLIHTLMSTHGVSPIPGTDEVTSIDLMQKILEREFPGYIWDDSSRRTAVRFIKFLHEYKPLPAIDFEFTTFDGKDTDSLVMMGNVQFSSICKHHLLPFFGKAHVAYIPHGIIVGASKIPRLVHFWSRRPQTQELLAESIAGDLKTRLNAKGVAVLLEATHTCMSCRGVRQVDVVMTTSVMKGVFLTAEAARMEFLSRINNGR